jgi:arabinogalactan endo-1,4-beta-galactosidase
MYINIDIYLIKVVCMLRRCFFSIILCLLIVFNIIVPPFFHVSTQAASFVCGADVSWLPQMEQKGYKFYDDNGVQKDCLQILKEHGINTIRLRVWVNPSDDPYSGHCSKAETVALAKRCAEMGFRIMIDFHYSDSWADPGKQYKPAAWVNHSFSQLLTDVYNHTYDVLSTLKTNGVTPEWVQVGNETNNGMLWEDGKASKSMKNFTQLINSGYDAVKAVFPGTKVIVHISNGYDNSLFRWIFDGLKNNGGKYDVIGMSLYPAVDNWSSMNNQCLSNMNDMVSRYGKEVMICEVGMDSIAPQATKDMLTDLLKKVKSVSGGKGLGVLYWEPQCYNWAGYGKGAWNTNGRPSIAMDAFLSNAAATATSTLKPTSTPAFKPTETPAGYKVSGYISPDFSFTSHSAAVLQSGFKIEIDGTEFSSSTNETGYFEINNVPESVGGYTIRISKSGYLYRNITGVSVTGNVQLGSPNSPVLLWSGDVVKDDAINISDIMSIAKAFNSVSGDEKYISECDLNKDNSINISDIMIVATHFNAVSTSYPAI